MLTEPNGNAIGLRELVNLPITEKLWGKLRNAPPPGKIDIPRRIS